MKTADLARSKRLKELGWEQESEFCWCMFLGFTHEGTDSFPIVLYKNEKTNIPDEAFERICSAPTAGEMIEWLLGEGKCFLEIDEFGVTCNYIKANRMRHFYLDDGLCNALADACAWVKERKK